MAAAVVIGAGPAGLTAAYELSKLGLRATVLEANDRVGGLACTVNYHGYWFDIGGHRFFSKLPFINDLWHEILGEDFLLRPRLSRIYYRERFFDYPLKAVNALAGLGPVEALLILLSYAKAKMLPSKEETSFEQWVSNRFGYRLYQTFFKTYTEKVWGIPCTELAADWAAQRIMNLSLHEVLRNALLSTSRTKDQQLIPTLIDRFHYPRLGPGMMWERCEEKLAARGSETVRGVHVERIRHRHGRVESVYGRTASGALLEFGGDHFISTMPLRELVHTLDPAAPDDVLQAARCLRYRDYLTVVLIVNRAEVFPDNWLYIHAPEVKMARVQNYKNWSPAMVPDSSHTSLGLEYFLWDQDEEWHWPDERLIELGIRECAQIGLSAPHEVEDGSVVRVQKAYPIYDQQYHNNIATVRRYLETLPNLQTIGRNGLHRYNNQDHAMLTGVYAARNIVGEKHDVWTVNTDPAYHEEGRVTAPTRGDRLVPRRVAPSVTEPQITPDELIEAAFARLDPLALGVAVGTVSGLGLFLATVALLLKGGPVIGPRLSLLGHYLPGFEVTWVGAFVGVVEAAIGGFLLGYVGAWLRNFGMTAYARLVRQRAETETWRRLLDRL